MNRFEKGLQYDIIKFGLSLREESKVVIVRAYRFSSKVESLDFLHYLFEDENRRNIDEVMYLAAKYVKHDMEIYHFFISEGEKLLSVN